MSQTDGKQTKNNTGVDRKDVDQNRRDFITLAATATAGLSAVGVVVPLATSLKPADDVLALASIEVDVSGLEPGQCKTVMWRGKPVFVSHRTEEQIAEARQVEMTELPDPEKDEDRVKKGKDQWLVTVGICTHLGCVPLNHAGDYSAWFCPCHGSHYDTSGRIRKGPAPKNLAVPQYEFINDTTIKIG